MPNIIFDTSSKLIILNNEPDPSTNRITYDVQRDIYSYGKEQWLEQLELNKFYIPIRAVGGDPLPGEKVLGDTYFLRPDWKIKPYEGSHVLEVNGNLYSEDGTSPFVTTEGTYNVTIISTVSNLVDSTVKQLPEIEYSSFQNKVSIDASNGTTGTDYPKGTPISPVNNVQDAISIAINRGFKSLFFIGDYHFDSNTYIVNYKLQGSGSQSSTFTFDAGAVVANCQIHNAKTTGLALGIERFEDCQIHNYGSDGSVPSSDDILLIRCILSGEINIPSTYTGKIICIDSWTGTNIPYDIGDTCLTINLNDASCNLLIRGYSGTVAFKNYSYSAGRIEIDLESGDIRLESSVTAGEISIRGVGILENFSDASVDADGLMSKETISKSVWAENLTKHTDIGTTGKALLNLDYRGEGTVYIDSSNGQPGTDYPIGTKKVPVNNLSDAIIIATAITNNRIHIIKYLFADQNVNNFEIEGDISWIYDTINLNGFSFNNSSFKHIRITGEQDIGAIIASDCFIEDLKEINGEFIGCRISGTNTVASHTIEPNAVFSAVGLVTETDDTIVDLQNLPAKVSLDVDSGIITFINAVEGSLIELNLRGGEIVLNESCTGGNFYAEGYGTLYNDSSMNIIDNHLLALETIPGPIWDSSIGDYQTPGTMGKTLASTVKETVKKLVPFFFAK